ncbi:MAG: hypothetical protein ACI9U0_002074 [Flavobacteriales bacterium]|jgi:hypothetical protein|tara:strand:- start:601 stop:1308 length:708 start_codon:yes stop_codon:yes gene_type:complete
MKKIFYLICIVFFAACSKEGEGGSAVISGIVKKEVIAPNGNLIETVAAINKDVFIKFGNSDFVNEDVKTNEFGKFEFPFLRKGEYSIFVYSDCIDCDSGKESIEQSVELKKFNSTISDLELVVRKTVDYDDGSSSVKGRLMVQKYVGEFTIGDPYVSQEQEVYIIYGNEEVYFDRMDTGFDGKFEFKGLIKGEYKLYALSECGTCIDIYDTVSVTVNVLNNFSSEDTGDLIIDKH